MPTTTNPIYRTAEMVSPMHPDKICDRISDAVLDAHLREDPDARVAVDVAGGHGTVFVTGEVTSHAIGVDVEAIVRRIAGTKLDGSPLDIIVNIAEQSPEIAHGVDTGGAGDQGIMVGYACDETPDLLPLEYVLARDLCKNLYERWPFDGKTQVTTKDGKIATIVASFEHASQIDLSSQVLKWVKHHPLAIANDGILELHANPAGDWDLGGFDADAGLTGRKLAVDNYGPGVPLGGGAFSGKDPSKVDRSGAYMARHIATDYLKARGAHEVYVYLAYAIGYSEPVEASVIIDDVHELIEGYDLSPNGIIALLNLQTEQYEPLASFGHFK
jgi:S-adenosylmethionine synthetase